jgi:hypothetical protein
MEAVLQEWGGFSPSISRMLDGYLLFGGITNQYNAKKVTLT